MLVRDTMKSGVLILCMTCGHFFQINSIEFFFLSMFTKLDFDSNKRFQCEVIGSLQSCAFKVASPTLITALTIVNIFYMIIMERDVYMYICIYSLVSIAQV